MTSLNLRSANPAKSKADVLVVGLIASAGDKTPTLAPGAEEVSKALGRRLAPLLSGLGLKGAAGEATLIPAPDKLSCSNLLMVGVGPENTEDAIRRAAGVAARSIGNAASVAVALPADEPEQLRAAVEGYQLGGYTFTTYRSGNDSTQPAEIVFLTGGARRKEFTQAFEDAQVTAAAVARVRDWVNTPPGDLTPPVFADAVKEAGKPFSRGGNKVSITVHDEKALAEMGCGGLIGVGQASDAPPRLVELSYKPRGAQQHLALVGKGITFDSGGLSIKPGGSMKTMKLDMAGAAAVVAATYAIAELKLPIRVSTYVAMAENMVSGRSTRPGDVLTMYDGTTVEVSNTDAEGRLVLADALGRAVEQKPDVIVDVATLTGAMQVALGDDIAGVMGDDEIVAQVLEAAGVAGEYAWPMPLPEHMTTRVKSSKIADLAQHDWIRWGGGLYAGAFLAEFTGTIPWAHIDIAGPSFNGGAPKGHITVGGTGHSTTTLIDLARNLAKQD